MSAERPAPGPPRAYQFPRAVTQTLSNGLAVHVATLRRLPTATALLSLDAGAERDPAGEAGVGSLTASGLAEGTMQLSADALADAFERLGGTLDVDLVWTRAECATTVLASSFPEALRLLGEVVREPAFPAAAIERLRDERLAELLQQRAEPRALADDMFARAVYRGDSRYALPEGGDEESVRPLGREQVATHYRARYGPRGARLIIAGDVEPATAFALAESLFGDWAVPNEANGVVSSEPARATRAIHLVEKGEAPQSELRFGHTTVSRRHPDFYAIAVMNAILGGLFNSRINLNLRERHGYTYGAFSAFDWRRGNSAFEVSTAVGSDVTAAAVREVLSEIDQMREQQVSASELSLARDYMTGVFPIRFETTEAIAEAIAMRESYELEPDYYDTYRDRIAAISADEVLSAAQRYLIPERMQVVAVADGAVVRDSLEALDIGELHVVNVESSAPAP